MGQDKTRVIFFFSVQLFLTNNLIFSFNHTFNIKVTKKNYIL